MIIELSTKGTRTTLGELLTGKCYIGTVPRHELRDPFQDALPCWLWAEGINDACVQAADLAQVRGDQ